MATLATARTLFLRRTADNCSKPEATSATVISGLNDHGLGVDVCCNCSGWKAV